MAYDKELAERISATFGTVPIVEKKMFGGIGYLLHGHMACGVLDNALIVRVGKEDYGEALTRPHTRVFDTTGRVMNGWVMVNPAGTADEDDLSAWVEQGIKFVLTLPPK
ncbi:MAG: TfoX/Sxy family protein [Anaerolineae bacterium]|jgi:TfoX/Sxy family transcriptional regulator of competence genes|nr:TfoX/Sxy family protein [Anaerolineae bacterium]MBT3714386.1 TfoX/Sxy family protein [Anaerolineae bacterium]MBT4309295.1 TfoX/Sxy family protein [Anaerolineae bacterium]MBT4457228.1 TfoX/Sxy family protein [Anaerolineae bacterium]MBT4841939.1 TfoX/Sxy family protein [Anaerolineae bacterium]